MVLAFPPPTTPHVPHKTAAILDHARARPMASNDASSPSTLRVIPPNAESEDARRLASERRMSLRLRLGTLLHSTLDLTDLIQQFGRELAREISGAGMLFQPPGG